MLGQVLKATPGRLELLKARVMEYLVDLLGQQRVQTRNVRRQAFEDLVPVRRQGTLSGNPEPDPQGRANPGFSQELLEPRPPGTAPGEIGGRKRLFQANPGSRPPGGRTARACPGARIFRRARSRILVTSRRCHTSSLPGPSCVGPGPLVCRLVRASCFAESAPPCAETR